MNSSKDKILDKSQERPPTNQTDRKNSISQEPGTKKADEQAEEVKPKKVKKPK